MTLFGYDMTVATLVDAGVPREKAEARARELYPDVAAKLDAIVVRNANVLERREQQVVWQMGTAVGLKGYWLSQVRDSKQTPGLPDLWWADVTRWLCFWWETKRQVGGERAPEQLTFAAECEAAGVSYGFGDRYDFAAFLQARGITPPAIPTD